MSVVASRSGAWWVERWGEDRGDAHCVRRDGQQLRWSELRVGLEREPHVRAVLTEAIRSYDAEALYWECTPWKPDADPLFEMMIIPTRAMVKRATNGAAFEEHFDGSALVHTFPSLGRDAELVVPAPLGRTDTFGHLASWIRSADEQQVDALWIAVGNAIAEWNAQDRGTLWVSTAGGGVPWLHVRLDSRPKYYKHAPYRSA